MKICCFSIISIVNEIIILCLGKFWPTDFENIHYSLSYIVAQWMAANGWQEGWPP